MQEPDYDSFFAAYVDFYNAALEGKPVIDDLRHCYAEFVVGASGGKVVGGDNGEDYGKVLEQGFAFYRAIGIKGMRLRGVDVFDLLPDHDRVQARFTAELEPKQGRPATVDFEVTYLLQRRDSGPKIFAFMSQDEMALFRELGLVDAQGQPAA